MSGNNVSAVNVILTANNTPVTKESHDDLTNELHDETANDETANDKTNTLHTNSFYIDTGNQGTIRVVEHFIGSQTYEDVIKAALRREFAE